MQSESLRFIAELVTPAVMVSSAGLLLLGLHSKYSNIVNRIRSIIEERNGLQAESEDRDQIANLTQQIDFLMRRAWCARNAIVCLYVSILFMIGTSICYAMVLAGFAVAGRIAVGVFIVGIVFLFIGCLFALIEVQHAYRVICLEIQRHKTDI